MEGRTGGGQIVVDSGSGKEEEWGADGRVKRCWREGQHRRGRDGIEIRRQNEDRAWTKLSAGRKERQVQGV